MKRKTPHPLDQFVATTDAATIQTELVVDPKRGTVRQAGAATSDGEWITALKQRAEESLYTFCKAILGRTYLTERLHKDICDWLTDLPVPAATYPPEGPKRRKGLLMFREGAKSTLVSHALPMHILIQPRDTNIYFPGEDGCEQRVVLACETLSRGKDHLQVQRRTWERNSLLRAFWPQRCWDKPSVQAPVWNNNEYTIPRETDWPDPSVRTIGVDGAITGAHPSVLVKDDLVTLAAANSEQVMHDAIEWHKASRALVNKKETLEYIIGTRWAVHDLYSFIQQSDPTVDWIVRSLIEDSECVYPEVFTEAKIEELRRDLGPRFFLMYMNLAEDPSLVDFDLSMLRTFKLMEGDIDFDEDGRDVMLEHRLRQGDDVPEGTVNDQTMRGKPLSALWSGRENRRLDHLRPSAVRLRSS